MRELTQKLSVHAPLLKDYHGIIGEYDFIRGKAKLAIDIDGNYPLVQDNAHVNLVQPATPVVFI